MGLTGAFGLWSLAKVEQGQASMPMCLNTQLCHAAMPLPLQVTPWTCKDPGAGQDWSSKMDMNH